GKRLGEMEKTLREQQSGLQKLEGDELAKAEKRVAEQKKKIEDATKQLAEMRVKKKPGVIQPRTKQMMTPQPLDRSPIELKAGDDPRVSLVKWITDPSNGNFSGAMVNRLWKHFMGVGLVEPVDDLRASNPPTNPELWRLLNK